MLGARSGPAQRDASRGARPRARTTYAFECFGRPWRTRDRISRIVLVPLAWRRSCHSCMRQHARCARPSARREPRFGKLDTLYMLASRPSGRSLGSSWESGGLADRCWHEHQALHALTRQDAEHFQSPAHEAPSSLLLPARWRQTRRLRALGGVAVCSKLVLLFPARCPRILLVLRSRLAGFDELAPRVGPVQAGNVCWAHGGLAGGASRALGGLCGCAMALPSAARASSAGRRLARCEG